MDKSIKIKPSTMPDLGVARHRKAPIVDTMPRRRPQRKAITWRATAAAMIPLAKYRKFTKTQSQDTANGLPSRATVDVSLIQAARDGLLDIVQAHLRSGNAQIDDVDEDSLTAMHHAARYDRVNVLEALIEARADVNVRGGPEEMTPLHIACRYNSVSNGAVQLLLFKGAEINARDIKGKTPLHYATRRGHKLATKMLLAVHSCDVNAADNDLITPLHMASMISTEDNIEICELLISRGADVLKRDINDMTPLMWAASEGCHKVMQLLMKSFLKLGADRLKDYVRQCDNEGSSALHMAVSNGVKEDVELLLDNFADINCQKLNLATPLHVAAVQGVTSIAELLLFRGAEVDKKDSEQMTPMHKAALFNQVTILDLLYKHGGNINAKDKKNMSPLHCACWKGQTAAVEYLLSKEAAVDDIDGALKTVLHWCVQFGHYETLLVILKHGASSLMEKSDKNDQTVLHYAAYYGNIAVLKLLLEYGAKTDATDQEERKPLHIAAQYDNVSCVEALIHQSCHEINDDDMDGHTPLLLACQHGHQGCVHVLLALGADVSKRDDEHRTALMLAAANGHTQVMRTLLDNHAKVNDVDKMKNTAMHYACACGHVEAVQLLLENRSNVSGKNTHDQAPIDMAIDNLHNDVATVLLQHKTWRDSVTVRDKNGMMAFDKLIAKLPIAARIVLDKCVERNSRDNDDPNLVMTFDYQFIDPGPDDPSSEKKRYFALSTMVKHERDGLLSHPVCQNILSQKWIRYGRTIFGFNVFVYLGYLLTLNVYSIRVKRLAPDLLAQCNNETAYSEAKRLQLDTYDVTDPLALLTEKFLYAFMICYLLRELVKIISQRLAYLVDIYNIFALVLFIATLIFISPPGKAPCEHQWRAGWIAIFLAYICFIMYLRRIDFLGIYVIMFVTVLVSLLKAVLVFMLFCFAFSFSFSIVVQTQNHPGFATHWRSIMNIFVMALGEIEYTDNFLAENCEQSSTREPNPFAADTSILLAIFLFLVSIVLMNLMIGIAVGDIEKIQHNAYLKRIDLQVELLYSIESSMPLFFQQMFYVRRATVRPNQRPSIGRLSKLKWLLCGAFGRAESLSYIEGGDVQDKMKTTMTRISDELRAQNQRMRQMQSLMTQQAVLLQQVASRIVDPGALPIVVGAGGHEGGPGGDSSSLYEANAGAIQRDRIRSMRDPGDRRPSNAHI